MLILLVLAGLSLASDPDGVVSTAPRGADAVVVGAVAPVADSVPDATVIAPTPQSLTTAQQIDRWISTRTASDAPFAQDSGPVDDRQMHGFVSGAIGTGDFSAVATGVSLPIGDSGRLDLTYSQSQNGYGYGYPGWGYGDFGYAGSDFGYAPRSLGRGRGGYGRDRPRGDSDVRQSFGLSYQSSSNDDRPSDDRR
ncbi:hypothetical protein BZG35_08190 [Brevundimonas sp. LM2]|uniref:hypothetical protein n=1 Tax=Brevundimonas sp. LM2 TaxID=1938605 RepID=UPI000983D07C|nr:hypothetical protein [Brevundimonas sp. LM2]AQR61631.1 hypothetical protein BZG35_08190 [Brevundimonas sp. LM2]